MDSADEAAVVLPLLSALSALERGAARPLLVASTSQFPGQPAPSAGGTR